MELKGLAIDQRGKGKGGREGGGEEDIKGREGKEGGRRREGRKI